MEAQVYAAIQMGYFKAKHIFFRFSFHKVPQDDLRFILTHCFTNQTLQAFNITKYEHYRVCGSMTAPCGTPCSVESLFPSAIHPAFIIDSSSFNILPSDIR